MTKRCKVCMTLTQLITQEINMSELFDVCVDILIWISNVFNITYKEANIWIFVIIEPIVFFIMLFYIYYLRYKLNTKSNG